MDLNDLPEITSDIPDSDGKVKRTQSFSTPESAEPSEDKEEKFQRIIKEQGVKNKILRYKVSFGQYLLAYDYKINDLDNLSIDELEQLLMEIEICVSSRTSGNMIQSYYLGAVSMTERVAPILGMNLQGLSQVLTENAQIKETLDELSIKYDVVHYTKPEVRLAYLTLQSIMAVNSINKKKEKTQQVLSAPVPQKTVEEFKDL